MKAEYARIGDQMHRYSSSFKILIKNAFGEEFANCISVCFKNHQCKWLKLNVDVGGKIILCEFETKQFSQLKC
jgi:hypothetical protein